MCLSGGTFENLRRSEHSVAGLREAGFEVFIHHRVPPNDGGLALGQAVIANDSINPESRAKAYESNSKAAPDKEDP